MSSGTRSRSPPRNGPISAAGSGSFAGAGGIKRMHGFSVSAAAEEDEGDLAANAPKRPREASLPSAGNSSMRVVLPSGQSQSGGESTPASVGAESPAAPTTVVGIAESLSDYNRNKAGAGEEYGSEEGGEGASPPQVAPPSVPMPSYPKKVSKAPVGKVVETGQEHTGRWTKEEHDAFLVGLKMYGKEWKK